MNELWRHLCTYTNKQVIINDYQDGELIAKDGYSFDRITISGGQLLIMRGETVIKRIAAQQYLHIEAVTGFPHHYAIGHDTKRLELYFVSGA